MVSHDSALELYGPEQVELAIAQALARALTTPRRLTQAVAPGPKTLRDLVAGALDEAGR